MKKILVIFLLLFCISCNKTRKNDEIYIANNVVNDFKIQDVLSDFQFIKLETNADCLVDDESKIKVYNDTIFISDGLVIHKYSPQGKYLMTINHVGRGPQEYQAISSFDIIDNKIIISHGWSKKILIYSTNNEFIKELFVDFNPTLSIILNDSLIVFSTGYYNVGDQIVVYNYKEEKIESGFLPIEEKLLNYMFFIGIDKLTSLNDTIIFNDFMSDKVYSITLDNAVLRYRFNFYDRNPTDEFWKKDYSDVREFIETFNERDYVCGMNFFVEAENSMLFGFRDGEKGGYIGYYDKDKSSSKIFNQIIFNVKLPVATIFETQIHPQKDGYFVMMIPAYLFFKDGKLLTNEFGEFTENDNPILMIGKLK